MIDRLQTTDSPQQKKCPTQETTILGLSKWLRYAAASACIAAGVSLYEPTSDGTAPTKRRSAVNSLHGDAHVGRLINFSTGLPMNEGHDVSAPMQLWKHFTKMADELKDLDDQQMMTIMISPPSKSWLNEK